MLQKLRQQLEAPGASPEVLKQVLACLRLIARIFYSLNGMGLTEVRAPERVGPAAARRRAARCLLPLQVCLAGARAGRSQPPTRPAPPAPPRRPRSWWSRTWTHGCRSSTTWSPTTTQRCTRATPKRSRRRTLCAPPSARCARSPARPRCSTGCGPAACPRCCPCHTQPQLAAAHHCLLTTARPPAHLPTCPPAHLPTCPPAHHGAGHQPVHGDQRGGVCQVPADLCDGCVEPAGQGQQGARGCAQRPAAHWAPRLAGGQWAPRALDVRAAAAP
jgi:hypothetical protein